jgi:phytoene synthase
MNNSRQYDSEMSASAANADSVLATKGRSFHWARHLLGTVHARRATRLYHLCRYIDDLADEGGTPLSSRQALLDAAVSLRNGHSNDPIIQDGLALIHECRIDASILLDLIAGVQSDLEPVRMPDLDSLLRYCYQVAGTVGLMMCKVLDTDSPAAFLHAVDLGIAMQLTNICRDVAADAEVDRRYLPASMIGEVAPDLLRNPTGQLRGQVQDCILKLLDCADTYYQSGELGLSYLPLRARGGILVAARVYREIGWQLRGQHHAYWNGRVVVSSWRKVAITSKALVAIPWSRFFWHHPHRHDDRLHLALSSYPTPSAAAFLSYDA